MATTGSFVAPPIPPCAYAPRMTRAAALALRAANGLSETCIVVITDGPNIGTVLPRGAGLSATEITLQPVANNEFSMNASVNTTYDNSAWQCVYDIDLNVFTMIRDNFGNVLTDPTGAIFLQFPFGVAGTERNTIEGPATLTQWGGGIVCADNHLSGGAAVDLTGVNPVGSVVSRNTIDSSQLLLTAGLTAHVFTDNVVRDGFIVRSNMTAAGGTANIDGCRFTGHGTSATGDLVIRATVGVTFIMNDCEVIAEATAVPALDIDGAGGTVNLVGCIFKRINAPTLTRVAAATGNLIMFNTELIGSSLSVASATSVSLNECSIRNGATITVAATSAGNCNLTALMMSLGAIAKAGVGNLTIVDVQLNQSSVNMVALSAASADIRDSLFQVATITVAATATNPGSVLTLQQQSTGQPTVTMNGQGNVSLANCQGSCTVVSAVGSTRSLQLTGLTLSRSTINQNGTGNTNLDSVAGGTITGDSTVNFNSTLAGTASTNMIDCNVTSQSTLSFTNPQAVAATASNVIGGSNCNVQTGGRIANCRFSAGANCNTGTFQVLFSIIDGNFTKTATANNINRLRNKSFDDWV